MIFWPITHKASTQELAGPGAPGPVTTIEHNQAHLRKYGNVLALSKRQIRVRVRDRLGSRLAAFCVSSGVRLAEKKPRLGRIVAKYPGDARHVFFVIR